MPVNPLSAASQAWKLARDFVSAAPGRCALAALLLLTAGATEAFGLLIIVPLLQVAASLLGSVPWMRATPNRVESFCNNSLLDSLPNGPIVADYTPIKLKSGVCSYTSSIEHRNFMDQTSPITRRARC